MLLAVDTSTRMVGIALYDGARVLGELAWYSSSYHTVELAPAVAELLEKTALRSEDLDAVGVAIGPGSFTALRIGLAFAKGLAFSRQIPLVGVPTLDILAAGQPVDASAMVALLQAGRKRYAVGWYQPEAGHWKFSYRLENWTLEELLENILPSMRVCGELDLSARQRLTALDAQVRLASPAESVRRPAVLAELAWERWQTGESDDPAGLSPLYLHHGDPIPG